MAIRISLTLKSFTSRFAFNRMALYSSTALVLSAGFYSYHSTEPTATIIASPYTSNATKEVESYSSGDYAPSANTNKLFQRITIPSGKATVINYNANHETDDLHHILITVHGEGDVLYLTTRNDNKIITGNENTIVTQPLKLGNSVGIPSTNWHQIVNKHDTKDLVLVVTSVPAKH